jgi:hypothetical protein
VETYLYVSETAPKSESIRLSNVRMIQPIISGPQLNHVPVLDNVILWMCKECPAGIHGVRAVVTLTRYKLKLWTVPGLVKGNCAQLRPRCYKPEVSELLVYGKV